MGRPSKLTDEQWEAVASRIIKGETLSDVARSLKMSKGTISERVRPLLEKLKTVAERVVETQQVVSALPVIEQRLVITMANRMSSIMDHVTSASEDKAAVSSKLARVARVMADKIDPNGPINAEDVKAIAVIVETSNRADSAPRDLMNANRDAGKGEGMSLADLVLASQGEKL